MDLFQALAVKPLKRCTSGKFRSFLDIQIVYVLSISNRATYASVVSLK